MLLFKQIDHVKNFFLVLVILFPFVGVSVKGRVNAHILQLSVDVISESKLIVTTIKTLISGILRNFKLKKNLENISKELRVRKDSVS